jgi:predicted SnoaL-like aldol condensation-catalyzing enzyme
MPKKPKKSLSPKKKAPKKAKSKPAKVAPKRIQLSKSKGNKASALAFLEMVIAGKIRQAYDTHVAPSMRHHNPYSKGDRESILLAMEEAELKFPQKEFKVQRAIEEGDTVAVHSRLKLGQEGPNLATVHIMRFESGKIVEFWDLATPVPPDSPNENTMF